MSAPVKPIVQLPNIDQVVSTKLVSAKTWEDVSNLTNACLGRGCQVVPCYDPMITIPEGTTYTFRHYAAGRYPSFDVAWTVTARTDGASAGTYSLKAPAGTGTEIQYRSVARRFRTTPAHYRQNLTSQSSSLREYTIDIEAVDGDLIVESIGAWEYPRLNLEVGGTEDGIEIGSVAHRQPIFRSANSGKSLGSVADAVVASLDRVRRASMMSFAWPTQAPLTTLSASYSTIFGFPNMIIPRKKYFQDTDLNLTLAVLAKGDTSAVEGMVKFARADGTYTEVSIVLGGGFGTFQWYTDDLDFLCEDTEEVAGLPGGDWETVTVSFKRTAGGTGESFDIAGICVLEV